MKKLLFLMLSISFLAISCTKDEEPAKPIDKFIGTFTGNFYENNCSDNVNYNTYENTKVEIKKENETDLFASIKKEDGSKLLSFSGKLKSGNDNLFTSSPFVFESDTIFANGQVLDGKLKISFGSFSCKSGENTYTATREFKEN